MDKKYLITSNIFSGFTFLMLVFFIIGIITHHNLSGNDVGLKQVFDACRYIDLVLCIFISVGCFVPNLLIALKSNRITKARMFIRVTSVINICLCIIAFCINWVGTFWQFWFTLGSALILLIVFVFSLLMTVKMQKTHQMISSV